MELNAPDHFALASLELCDTTLPWCSSYISGYFFIVSSSARFRESRVPQEPNLVLPPFSLCIPTLRGPIYLSCTQMTSSEIQTPIHWHLHLHNWKASQIQHLQNCILDSLWTKTSVFSIWESQLFKSGTSELDLILLFFLWPSIPHLIRSADPFNSSSCIWLFHWSTGFPCKNDTSVTISYHRLSKFVVLGWFYALKNYLGNNPMPFNW